MQHRLARHFLSRTSATAATHTSLQNGCTGRPMASRRGCRGPGKRIAADSEEGTRLDKLISQRELVGKTKRVLGTLDELQKQSRLGGRRGAQKQAKNSFECTSSLQSPKTCASTGPCAFGKYRVQASTRRTLPQDRSKGRERPDYFPDSLASPRLYPALQVVRWADEHSNGSP